MPWRTISLHRSPTSYARVRGWIGTIVRNRRFQLSRARIAGVKYLDLGCGPNTHQDFINLDYFWHPQIDVCWNVTRGLPFEDNSFLGVFSEHCLEHFAGVQASALLREVLRVLAPSGRLRLVVPDAELYLRTYCAQLQGDRTQRFPFQSEEERRGLWTPLASVNRVFYQDRESPFGHCQMYDHALLAAVLHDCGFTDVRPCRFGEGGDPRLLIDSPGRACESLYVEATKAR
jgi:SAM-dependent methyltransferase